MCPRRRAGPLGRVRPTLAYYGERYGYIRWRRTSRTSRRPWLGIQQRRHGILFVFLIRRTLHLLLLWLVLPLLPGSMVCNLRLTSGAACRSRSLWLVAVPDSRYCRMARPIRERGRVALTCGTGNRCGTVI